MVLIPLAVLICCAVAAEAGSDARRPEVPVQTNTEAGDRRDSGFSAARGQPVVITLSTGDQAAGAISKAGWSLGEFRPARRMLERWTPSAPISLVGFSSGASIAGSPTIKAFSASSLEYVILRQLRL